MLRTNNQYLVPIRLNYHSGKSNNPQNNVMRYGLINIIRRAQVLHIWILEVGEPIERQVKKMKVAPSIQCRAFSCSVIGRSYKYYWHVHSNFSFTKAGTSKMLRPYRILMLVSILSVLSIGKNVRDIKQAFII